MFWTEGFVPVGIWEAVQLIKNQQFMWWTILIVYILGYLGSLVFLGAVGESKESYFFWALLWPVFLLVLAVVIFFRSFYILGKFFYDEQEDFCKYWCDHILDC